MSEEKESLVDKIGSAVGDFIGSIFGESGKKIWDDVKESTNDATKWAATKGIELLDDLLVKYELDKNENFTKRRDTLKSALKDAGLIEE